MKFSNDELLNEHTPTVIDPQPQSKAAESAPPMTNAPEDWNQAGSTIAISYMTEKDETRDEALFMTAIVNDNTVELAWMHQDEEREACYQRCLARVKTIANTHTLVRCAVLTLRLHRCGDVAVSDVRCVDEYREKAVQDAKEAAQKLVPPWRMYQQN